MAARYLADKFADARVELITFGSAAGHNDAFAVRAHDGSHPIPSRLSVVATGRTLISAARRRF
jgi:hypothetical protein